MIGSTNQRNPTYLCQVCGGTGKLQSIRVRRSDSPDLTEPQDGGVTDSNDWDRIRSRTIQCQDCGDTWVNRR